MKQITVISGKGGTGKTTLTANLAALVEDLVLADCDVDAPNLHLLLNPVVNQESIFKGARLAVRDAEKCTDCKLCFDKCKFEAITAELVNNPVKCEGCGVCAAICPTGAINFTEVETGRIYHSSSKYGPVIHARLKAGAENSGKLVSQVRERAVATAEQANKELVFIDGSPGIGCPVISSLNGVDAALVVTEPTKSGIADLKRVLGVTEHFAVQTVIVINKADLNQELTAEIEKFAAGKDIAVAGKIPFDQVMVEAIRQGELIVDYQGESASARAVKEIWHQLRILFELSSTSG